MSDIIRSIDFSTPKTVEKGWGRELHIINNDLYCLKFLEFDAGKKFSFHSHWLKTETWYVLKGKLTMRYFNLGNADEIERELNKGDVIHIPAGNPHQLVAIIDSIIVEASTTDNSYDNYRIGKGDSQK